MIISKLQIIFMKGNDHIVDSIFPLKFQFTKLVCPNWKVACLRRSKIITDTEWDFLDGATVHCTALFSPNAMAMS